MGYVSNLGSLGEQAERLADCPEDAVHKLEEAAVAQKKSQVVSRSIGTRT